MTSCPHCNNRGWVKSPTPDRLVNLCACARPTRSWRPPGWAWGLAAFMGIVVANAIVPSAHGATLRTVGDDYTTVFVILACLGAGAFAALVLAVLCCGRTRADQLDQARRDALLRQVRQEAEAQESRAADRRQAERRATP